MGMFLTSTGTQTRECFWPAQEPKEQKLPRFPGVFSACCAARGGGHSPSAPAVPTPDPAGFSALCAPRGPGSAASPAADTRHSSPHNRLVCCLQLSKTRAFSAFIPLLCRAANLCFLSAILKIPMASAGFYSFCREENEKGRTRREVTILPSGFSNSEIHRKKTLNDPKATFPKSLGQFGGTSGSILKNAGLGSESAAHPGPWQVNSWLKGNCRVKVNPPVPNCRCWRQREQDLAEHRVLSTHKPSSAPPLQGSSPGAGLEQFVPALCLSPANPRRSSVPCWDPPASASSPLAKNPMEGWGRGRAGEALQPRRGDSGWPLEMWGCSGSPKASALSHRL